MKKWLKDALDLMVVKMLVLWQVYSGGFMVVLVWHHHVESPHHMETHGRTLPSVFFFTGETQFMDATILVYRQMEILRHGKFKN